MITVRIIIEIMGKPKDHVVETLQKMHEKLSEDDRFNVQSSDLATVRDVEGEDGYFSTYGEFELSVKNPSSLIELCFEYMPSNIEVLEPTQINFEYEDLSHLLSTVQSRLHQVDMVAKQVHGENKFLKTNMNLLLYNFLKVLITKEKRTIANLSQLTGVDEKRLGMYLDKLVDEKKVRLEDGAYTI